MTDDKHLLVILILKLFFQVVTMFSHC